jgi:signal transduction histidine kinase
MMDVPVGTVAARAAAIFEDQQRRLREHTSRLFAALMIAQWIAGIGAALWISPQRWSGSTSGVHPHVWAAVFLGGAICFFPVALALKSPAQAFTRHVIAVGQMLASALLIHLTGGRIETHFHVFGSLAFLAFYRDWRVLISASAVVAADHILRGIYWPESVYGVMAVEPWRWVEHAGWVVFEDFFLIISIRQGIREMISTAERQAELEKRDEVLKAFTAKLQRSNRELQDFAYVASHDLQEPLRKIQAFGDRLQERYGSALGDQGRDYLERMQNAAGRMSQLIKDLLDFSRITTTGQPFVRVDLAQVAREVLGDLEILIEKSGGQVELGALPTIDADPSQMRQLLQNLVGNGLKFHQAGATPSVAISADAVPQTPNNGDTPSADVCQLRVRDNGIGFDEKYLDRIFNVFQRLHGRGEYAGTGIGLAICRKIAERHGGSITANSELGKGATFVVTLPLKQNGAE